ncbi:MAG TPA: heat-inducible transcriptional repressor HrcA [Acidobacteriaceae bacterium]|jgi:heat-inducible transcriptional repressor|nr:heat-inducible transcriptional repressor HrcA [Acidobacteriaceae bacterium]
MAEEMANPDKTEGFSAVDRVSPRERLVLTSVVENYIANGEPVASQAIARQQNREGMSPATVRNVMADLSDAGYLDQPHTSAGRVPTSRAFRYYAEQLLRRGRVSGDLLPTPAQEQIDESLSGVVSAAQFLSRTSHILALLSGGVGVALTVAAGGGERDLLEHIHFTRLVRSKVLAVVVTTTGLVRDRVLVLDHDLTADELEAAARYLNQNFHTWTMERIRTELALRMEHDRSEYSRMLRSLEQLCRKGALDHSGQAESVFVDGASNLIASEADRERLRQILAALEEKQRVIDLLHAYVGDRQQAVRVVVGLEDAMPEMQNLTLIAAPARSGEEHFGTVAVIGPTRMQYENAIGGVTYVASLFERMLQAL